jgi:hypothetical protein
MVVMRGASELAFSIGKKGLIWKNRGKSEERRECMYMIGLRAKDLTSRITVWRMEYMHA